MAIPFKFRPKLFDCFATYNMPTFRADLSAGVTVGIIALPMAMAFAIGSKVTPEAGIVTAIIAGFLTSFFGGSRVAIGGPTGAFVAIVAGIVANYGLSGLLICTIMAGVILLVMGLARLGSLIRYIPEPLIRGFTSGIAVIILCSQIKDFLGIKANIDTSTIISTFAALVPHLHEISIATVVVSTLSIAGIYLWPKRFAKIVPGSIAVLLFVTLGTAIVTHLASSKIEGISSATDIIAHITAALKSLALNATEFMAKSAPAIESIGSRFGGIPRTLPVPSLPDFDLDTFQKLLTPAVTVAMLGAIESLLCATAADGMIDDEHDPDQELIAQGIANLVTPLFGGIPATGAIARTAANIRNGGRTPVSGIIHAVTLLLIMLIAAPLAKYIPLAVLSAVLIVVALNMGDWREFIHISRYPRSDAAVFLVTFLLTVIFGLTQAVMVGMFVACVLFIRRMSEQTTVGLHPTYQKRLATRQGSGATTKNGPPQPIEDVLIVRITGAMFFGAAQKLKDILLYLKREPRVLILKMTQVISLDATAILNLEDIVSKCQRKGVNIIFVGLENQPRASLSRAGLFEHIPKENILDTLDEALALANEILNNNKEEASVTLNTSD